MMKKVWIGFLLIALLCAFTVTRVHGADLVSADDDEFEDETIETRPTGGIPLEKKPSKALQQDNDFQFDADEFEGLETIRKQQIEEEVIEEETVEPEVKAPPKPKFGILEMSYLSFIVLFLGNYFVGKKANDKIATTWGQNFQNLFASNFVKYGDANKFIITKESAHCFSVSASGGRARCAGAVFNLDLNKRHDLTSYVSGIISPHKDTLTVEVAMNTNSPFCFGLMKKKEEKQFLKNHKEIADFAPNARVLARLPNYVIHTDSNEMVEDVITREVIDVLSNPANESLFSSISYSDVSTTYLKYNTMLTITYRIPPVEDMKKLADLMRLVFSFIDSFAAVQISKNTLLKNEAMRKKLVKQEKSEHEVRQEVAQKKKQDRLIAERAAYDKLSPEAQRRFDEKEEKRKVKAKQGKAKVVYS